MPEDSWNVVKDMAFSDNPSAPNMSPLFNQSLASEMPKSNKRNSMRFSTREEKYNSSNMVELLTEEISKLKTQLTEQEQKYSKLKVNYLIFIISLKILSFYKNLKKLRMMLLWKLCLKNN